MSQICPGIGHDAAVKRALVLALLVACGSNNNNKPADASFMDADPFMDAPIDAPVLPAFRTPHPEMSDGELAEKALARMGVQSPAVPNAVSASCNTCHGMTKDRLRYWRQLSDTSMTNCLTDLDVTTTESAKAMVNCMRMQPDVETSMFDTTKLGYYATAGRLGWFDYLFWKAYGPMAPAQKAAFINAAAMPHGSDTVPLTQEDFDIIAEWVSRGLPQLDAYMPPDGPPTTCTAYIGPDVQAHTTALATTGWRAINRGNNMAMFDCGTETDPRNCMTNQPLASTTAFGTGWDVTGMGHVRVLDDVTYHSAYWTRSSPDGRFIGYGASSPQSVITDLQRSKFHIQINALYDPGFFPDNSGWVFQGGPRRLCSMATLTSNPTSVAMTEAGCTSGSQIGLYQHVGKALGGGDYFTIDGQFVSDNGGHGLTTHQPAAQFDSNSHADFNPFVFNGTTYVGGSTISVIQPYEGDDVLSPSASLEMTRVANNSSQQIGYALHKVNIAGTAPSYTITTPEIARYCITGSKVAFSYDERWIVYHHYVMNTNADAMELGFTGTSDPGFAQYITKGAANLYVMDLATGVPHRITNMAPGQYAVMPHFRSDGWIYANVRDTVANHEYWIASDASLILEQ